MTILKNNRISYTSRTIMLVELSKVINHALTDYLRNHFGIDSLENYIESFNKEDLCRGEVIEVSSTSN